MTSPNAQVPTVTANTPVAPVALPLVIDEQPGMVQPPPITMQFGDISMSIQASDVEAHRRAGWTTDGPDTSTPA